MAEITLEVIAKRLADLERTVAELVAKPAKKDWQRTVGMFEGSEFMAQVDAEVMAAREAEREAARSGRFEMILLDTDHLTVLRFQLAERRVRLVARMLTAKNEVFGTTVINAAEQVKGWLAAIIKERDVLRQVTAYREFARLFDFYSGYHIADFDVAAANCFRDLRQTKIRIGTNDLKIAAIALTTGSLLLTANRQDFELVPGLRFANWLE